MKITKNDILFYVGLIFAIWFALFGIVWAYWAALIVAYPFGVISYLIWRSIKDENKKRTKFISIILTIGVVSSLSALIGLLIWG